MEELDPFKDLKHITKESGVWGDPKEMNPGLLSELDRFASLISTKIVVTSGFRKNDPKEHGKGFAVDVMFPWLKKEDLVDVMIAAMRFDFTGIGIYPDWELNGQNLGGLHLDIRKADNRALWLGRRTPTGRQEYVALNRANLKASGLI